MNWSTKDIPDLSGKVAIVTGGNAGMGFAVAETLAHKGARVIIAARSQERVQTAVNSIRSKLPTSQVEGMLVDFASMSSVKKFADDFLAKGLPLHILINNAAVFIPPFSRTPEGIEVSVGVNHFNSYYLTQLLLPTLKASAPARIVYVSSGAADTAPIIDWSDLKSTKATASDMKQYAISKQYNAMLAKALGKELQASNVTVALVDPGLVHTGIQLKSVGILPRIFYFLASIIGQRVDQGAAHITFAATAPGLEGKGFTAWTPKYSVFGKTSPWRPALKEYKDDGQCDRMLVETKAILRSLAAD